MAERETVGTKIEWAYFMEGMLDKGSPLADALLFYCAYLKEVEKQVEKQGLSDWDLNWYLLVEKKRMEGMMHLIAAARKYPLDYSVIDYEVPSIETLPKGFDQWPAEKYLRFLDGFRKLTATKNWYLVDGLFFAFLPEEYYLLPKKLILEGEEYQGFFTNRVYYAPALDPDSRVVAAIFDRFAPEYDDFAYKPLKDKVLSSLAEAVLGRARPGEKLILDAGVGTGTMAEYIPKGLVGVDISPKMAELARERGIPVYLANLEGGLSFFPDNHFDGAVLSFVMPWIHHPQAVFKTLKRVVKPSGVVAFSERRPVQGWQGVRQELLQSCGFGDILFKEIVVERKFADGAVDRIKTGLVKAKVLK